MQGEIDCQKYLDAIRLSQAIVQEGRVVKISGMVAEASGPDLGIGSLCAIRNADGGEIQAEVVGFKDNRVIVMPLGELTGIRPGSPIVKVTNRAVVPVGAGYLGRIIDGLGRPLDGGGMIAADTEYPVHGNRSIL